MREAYSGCAPVCLSSAPPGCGGPGAYLGIPPEAPRADTGGFSGRILSVRSAGSLGPGPPQPADRTTKTGPHTDPPRPQRTGLFRSARNQQGTHRGPLAAGTPPRLRPRIPQPHQLHSQIEYSKPAGRHLRQHWPAARYTDFIYRGLAAELLDDHQRRLSKRRCRGARHPLPVAGPAVACLLGNHVTTAEVSSPCRSVQCGVGRPPSSR